MAEATVGAMVASIEAIIAFSQKVVLACPEFVLGIEDSCVFVLLQ